VVVSGTYTCGPLDLDVVGGGTIGLPDQRIAVTRR
jgi:hypothetical protein